MLMASFPCTFTFAQGCVQSSKVQGIQGIGVNTPIAAAVAAITIGFAGLEHMPKGRMFRNGIWSDLTATGRTDFTFLSGSTIIGVGMFPKLHFNIVPCVTIGFILIPAIPFFPLGNLSPLPGLYPASCRMLPTPEQRGYTQQAAVAC